MCKKIKHIKNYHSLLTKRQDLNRYLYKENTELANRHMKKCLTSLAIRKMQIKTTERFHFTPTQMTINQRQITNVGDDVKKLQASYTASKNVNYASTVENSLTGSQKDKHRNTI